jgi:hypothetical protein
MTEYQTPAGIDLGTQLRTYQGAYQSLEIPILFAASCVVVHHKLSPSTSARPSLLYTYRAFHGGISWSVLRETCGQ